MVQSCRPPARIFSCLGLSSVSPTEPLSPCSAIQTLLLVAAPRSSAVYTAIWYSSEESSAGASASPSPSRSGSSTCSKPCSLSTHPWCGNTSRSDVSVLTTSTWERCQAEFIPRPLLMTFRLSICPTFGAENRNVSTCPLSKSFLLLSRLCVPVSPSSPYTTQLTSLSVPAPRQSVVCTVTRYWTGSPSSPPKPCADGSSVARHPSIPDTLEFFNQRSHGK
mmetsp:Transcript_10630/g.27329  ORF Transcript_10630/g.27329 Transcript_10630/m.27329 type:complete len:221 (+) Transcript_10630:1669-2331(+)